MINTAIRNVIRKIELDDICTRHNLTLYRLGDPSVAGPDYLTLRMAMKLALIDVTEVSAGGSVPELSVHNKADKPVLILDGEELIGAKQNRVLNTTVMVAPGAHMKVPVSCVEQGRWRRESVTFEDSDQVMFSGARSRKVSRVSRNLMDSGRYDAGQGEVWGDISACARSFDIHSPTGAMSDIFAASSRKLDEYVEKLPPVEGQCGLMALVDGEVAGLDLVSRPAAYLSLHDKLLRSYAMEALRRFRRREADQRAKAPEDRGADPDPDQLELPGLEGESQSGAEPQPEAAARAAAAAFLDTAADCDEQIHASVGMGEDHRLSGKGVVGSALMVDRAPIHLAIFPESGKKETAPVDGGSLIVGFRGGSRFGY